MNESVQERPTEAMQKPAPSDPSNHLRTLGESPKVSAQLLEEIRVKEVAQAIVFLRPSTGLAAVSSFESQASEIEREFVVDDRSWFAALAKSATPALAGPGYSALSLSASTRAGRKRGLRRHAPAPEKREVGPVRFPELGAILGDLHSKGLEALSRNANVQYVASSLPLSLIRPINVAAAAPATQTTWGITAIDVDRLWAENYDGSGIRVGHVDTGVDGTHPVLKDAVKGFLLTDDVGFPVAGAPIRDTGVHGTHTAGTIAGRPVAGRSGACQ